MSAAAGALAAAERAQLELREQINELTHARARAESEATRLRQLAGRAQEAASYAQLADRYQHQAGVLDGELSALRQRLEEQRLMVERLRAEVAGA